MNQYRLCPRLKLFHSLFQDHPHVFYWVELRRP
jgi:hypothetical protein